MIPWCFDAIIEQLPIAFIFLLFSEWTEEFESWMRRHKTISSNPKPIWNAKRKNESERQPKSLWMFHVWSYAVWVWVWPYDCSFVITMWLVIHEINIAEEMFHSNATKGWKRHGIWSSHCGMGKKMKRKVDIYLCIRDSDGISRCVYYAVRAARCSTSVASTSSFFSFFLPASGMLMCLFRWEQTLSSIGWKRN